MKVLGSLGSWRFWPRRGGHPSRRNRKSAGYNLVVLAVTVTVMNIMVAKALPMWSHQIQREKEAELIFRGLQYAEAIRLFEVHNGRLPNKLEELVADGQRRFLRQLWTNPMSEDGKWGLIFQDAPVNRQGRNQDRNQGRGRDREEEAGQNDPFGLPRSGEEVRVGPIVGVYSREGGEAIKVFAPVGGGGGSDVSQWRFTKDLLQGLGSRGVGAGDGAVQVPTMNAADIGKPWPQGIILPRFQGGRGGVQNRGVGGGNNGRDVGGSTGGGGSGGGGTRSGGGTERGGGSGRNQ